MNKDNMKESKLIEMGNRIETLGQAIMRLTEEISMLKTLAMGDHQLIKLLPGFTEALEELKAQHEEETKKEENG